VRVSYGHKLLHVLLRREGWSLAVKREHVRPSRAAASAGRWTSSMTRWRTAVQSASVSVVDAFTRECVALVAKRSFRGQDFAHAPELAAATRPLPSLISVKNATEFTSKILYHWAYRSRVQLDFSRRVSRPTTHTSRHPTRCFR
jgi:putative transposase